MYVPPLSTVLLERGGWASAFQFCPLGADAVFGCQVSPTVQEHLLMVASTGKRQSIESTKAYLERELRLQAPKPVMSLKR